MKLANRFLAMLLAMLMVISAMPVFAFAASVSDFSDFPVGTWSEEAMTAAVDNHLLVGKGNGIIAPKDYLTRAEAAAVINRAFGATVKADLSAYTDADTDKWYYAEMEKAVNMQTIVGVSATSLAPEALITRESMFSILARALVLDDGDTEVLSKFADGDEVSGWASKAVAAMVEAGYVFGNEKRELKPLSNITREEFAQVMHNIFKVYIPDTVTISGAKYGTTIIRAKDVTLTNVFIDGDLIAGDGVGDGDLNITNSTITGRILFRGGEGKVKIKNSTVGKYVIVNDVNGTVNFYNYRSEAPFKGIRENTPATFLNLTISNGGGSSTPSREDYKIREYLQNVDGTYPSTASYTDKKTTTYGKTIVYESREIRGFTFDDKHPDSVLTGVNKGNLVLKAYYKRNTHKVIFNGVEYELLYGQNIEKYKEDLKNKMEETVAENKEHGYDTKFVDGNGKEVKIDDPILEDLEISAIKTPIIYTITYNLNGGTLDGSQKVKYTVEDEDYALPNPSKRGYEFKGWSDENGNPATIIAKGSLGNKTFTASWDAIEYQITYDLGGIGSLPAGTKTTYTIEELPFRLPQLAHTDEYTFEGWKDAQGNFVTEIPADTINNITFKAEWKEIPEGEFAITYNLNEIGSLPAGTKQTYKPSELPVSLPDVEDTTSYRFVGWYDNAAFAGSAVTEIPVGTTGPVTYYAKWEEIKFIVTFNGVPYGIAAESKLSSNADLKDAMEEAQNKPGYTVTFNTKADGSGTNVTPETVPEADMTIYAVEKLITYTITYNTNNGTLTGEKKTYTVEDNTFTLAVPTKTNYSFKGWYESSDFSGSAVTKIEKGTTGNKTFYAKWEEIKFIVTFNGVPYEITAPGALSSNADLKDAMEEAKNKPGYTVTFNTKADGSGTDVTPETVPGADMTIYAVEKLITYTITYNTNNGTLTGEKKTYTVEDDTFTLAVPTRTNYSFEGWYESSDFSGSAVTKIEKGTTGNKTFYAKWRYTAPGTEIYKVTFNGTDYDVTENLPLSSNTNLKDAMEEAQDKTGYDVTFKDSKGNPVDLNTVPEDDMTIIVVETPVEYDIEYILNNGMLDGTQKTKYTIEDDDYTLPVPEKSGHVFRGWYESSDFGGTEVKVVKKGSTGNKTFYAKWVEDNSILSFDHEVNGDVVTVKVMLNSVPADIDDIAAMTLRYAYDNTKLEYVKTESNFGDASATAGNISWYSDSAYITNEALAEKGNVLFTITFSRKGGAYGDTEISYVNTEIVASQPEGNPDIAKEYDATEVETINLGTAPSTPSKLYFEGERNGDVVTVKVMMDAVPYDVNDIAAMTLRYAYDNTKLEYVKTESNFGDASATAGNISWYSDSAYITNEALAEKGNVLFTITFSRKGGAYGDTEISYVNTEIVASQPVGNPAIATGYTTEDETVNLGTAPSTPSKLYFEGERNGDVVTVKVMMDAVPYDVNDIAAMTLRYAYDNTKLEYVKTESNFGDASATAGNISWYSDSAYITNEALAEKGNVLFTITFSRKGGAYGDTEISYVNTEIVASQPVGNPAIATGYTTEDETVNLGTAPSTPSKLYFEGERNGDVVTVKVMMDAVPYDVNDIAAMTLRYAYDNTKLEYVKTESNFGDASATAGNISWYSDSAYITNEALAEKGNVLFTITFSRKADAYGDTEISYVNTEIVASQPVGNPAIATGYTTEDETVNLGTAPAKYIITFNGETYEITAPGALSSNEDLKDAMEEAQNKPGYTVTFKDGEGNPVTVETVPSGYMTIIIVEEAINYTISYDLGGIGVLPSDAKTTYNAKELPYTLPVLNHTADYTFEGWEDANGNPVTAIVAGTTGNLVFKAIWEEIPEGSYTITYDLDGIGTLPADAWTTYKTSQLPYTLPVLTHTEDYTFEGWEDANGNPVTEIVAGTTGNLVFKAIWEEIPETEYTITYDLDGIGTLPADAWTTYKTSQLPYTLPVLNDTADYTFEGWEDENGNPVTAIVAGTTGNLVFKAIWEEIPETEYTITYDLDGIGTLPADAWTTYKTSQLPYILPVLTHTEDYTFEGWEDANGNPVTEIVAGTTGNLVFKAIWKEIPEDAYTITYVLNGGELDGTQKTTYKSSELPYTLPVPTKGTTPFAGWYEAEDFSGDAVTTITAGTTGDKVYYAKWQKYTVKFYEGTVRSTNYVNEITVEGGATLETAVIEALENSKGKKPLLPANYNPVKGYTDADGEEHKIYPELYYEKNGEWVKYIPEEVPVLSDMNVCLLVRYLSFEYNTDLNIKGIDLSELNFSVTVSYDSDTDLGKTFLDVLTNFGETMDRVLGQVEDQGVDLYQAAINAAASKGLMDTDGNILNPQVPVPLHKFITKERIMQEIDSYINSNINNEEFIADILRNDTVVKMLLEDDSIRTKVMEDPSMREKLITDSFINEMLSDSNLVSKIVASEEFKKRFIESDSTIEYVLDDGELMDMILNDAEFHNILIDECVKFVVDVYFEGTKTSQALYDYIEDVLHSDEFIEEIESKPELKDMLEDEIKDLVKSSDAATKAEVYATIRDKSNVTIRNNVIDVIKTDAGIKAEIKNVVQGDATLKADIKATVKNSAKNDIKSSVKTWILDKIETDANMVSTFKGYILNDKETLKLVMKDIADVDNSHIEDYINGTLDTAIKAEIDEKIDTYLADTANVKASVNDYFDEIYSANYENMYDTYFDQFYTDDAIFDIAYNKFIEDEASFTKAFDSYVETDENLEKAFNKFMENEEKFDEFYQEFIGHEDQFNTLFERYYTTHVHDVAKKAYDNPSLNALVMDYVHDYTEELVIEYADGTLNVKHPELVDAIDELMHDDVPVALRNAYANNPTVKVKIDELIETNATEIISKHLAGTLDSKTEEFLEDEISKYIDDVIDSYIDGTIDSEMKEFVDGEIDEYMEKLINDYISGTDRETLSDLIPTYAQDAVDAIKDTDDFKNTINEFVSGNGVRVHEGNLMFVEIIADLMADYGYEEVKSFLPAAVTKIVDAVGEQVARKYINKLFDVFSQDMQNAVDLLNADLDADISGTSYKFSTTPKIRVNYLKDFIADYYYKLSGKLRDKVNSQSKIPVSSNPYAQRIVDTDFFSLYFDEGAPADEYKSGYKLKDDIMDYYNVHLELAVLMHDAITFYGQRSEYSIEDRLDSASLLLGTYANKANDVIMNFIENGELPKGYTLEDILNINGKIESLYNKFEDKILKGEDLYAEYLDKDYTDIIDFANMSIYSDGEAYKIYQIILECGENAFDFDDAMTAIFDAPNYHGVSQIENIMAKIEGKIKQFEYTPDKVATQYNVDAYKAVIESKEIKGQETGTHEFSARRYLQYKKSVR